MSLLDQQMLPQFIRNMKQMRELLEAEQIELDRMYNVIKEQEKQLCINTADQKLARYEQMFALDPTGLTAIERRRNLIAKLNARITATKQNMIHEIQRLTGHPVEIKEYYDQYMFTVGLIQNDLSDAFVRAVRLYLDEIKPAHLGYDLSLIRYEESLIKEGIGMVLSSIMSWEVDLSGI